MKSGNPSEIRTQGVLFRWDSHQPLVIALCVHYTHKDPQTKDFSQFIFQRIRSNWLSFRSHKDLHTYSFTFLPF